MHLMPLNRTFKMSTFYATYVSTQDRRRENERDAQERDRKRKTQREERERRRGLKDLMPLKFDALFGVLRAIP